MKQVELVSHPVRMRLALALANRVLTTQQLAELMPDVAQTSLYRHINLLLEGGILTVVSEVKVRGTVERALTLVKGAGRIDLETAMQISPEQREQMFTTFLAMLMADYHRAQSHPLANVPSAIYTQQRLYLSLSELRHLNDQMDALLAPYKDQSRQHDEPDSQHWLFTGIVMPDTDISANDQEDQS